MAESWGSDGERDRWDAFALATGNRDRLATWWSSGLSQFSQFRLEDRTALRTPPLDFREQMVQREPREPSSQRGQHRHDHAASLGTAGRLARAAALADLRFPANVPFAAIVGRIDLGMLDENEQASQIVDQFVLQADERRLMLRLAAFVNGLAVPRAERTNPLLQGTDLLSTGNGSDDDPFDNERPADRGRTGHPGTPHTAFRPDAAMPA